VTIKVDFEGDLFGSLVAYRHSGLGGFAIHRGDLALYNRNTTNFKASELRRERVDADEEGDCVDFDIDKGELDRDNDKLWEWKYDAAFTLQVIYARLYRQSILDSLPPHGLKGDMRQQC